MLITHFELRSRRRRFLSKKKISRIYVEKCSFLGALSEVSPVTPSFVYRDIRYSGPVELYPYP